MPAGFVNQFVPRNGMRRGKAMNKEKIPLFFFFQIWLQVDLLINLHPFM